MEKLLHERKAKVVIELGSWMGKSTRHIAKTLPEDGIVYAVDHWLGNPQSRINTPQLIPTLYEQFLSNMIHANLTHKVVPLRMTTQEAIGYFYANNIVPDLIYVDASHEEEDVYQDIVSYYPLIEKKGVICGDDWSFGDLPVQRAVKRFAKENNLDIAVSNGWFWELKKKK
jgi:predicted O-methyltransferase YrrM